MDRAAPLHWSWVLDVQGLASELASSKGILVSYPHYDRLHFPVVAAAGLAGQSRGGGVARRSCLGTSANVLPICKWQAAVRKRGH
jgi:hypothetical protein